MAEQKGYIIKDREQSAVAESFRALRTTIQDAQTEHPLQTVLFASASPGDGSAMAAANTAVTLAYAGKKVILIDGDLRRPLLHKVFELQDTGLTNIINEGKTLAEMLQSSGINNLMVLASGSLPTKPFELLSDPTMRAIIEQAKTLADYVIINSSPLIVMSNAVVSDACVLAAKVDGVVLVLDAMSVRVKVAQKVLALLKGTRSRIIGVLLNDAKDDKDFVY